MVSLVNETRGTEQGVTIPLPAGVPTLPNVLGSKQKEDTMTSKQQTPDAAVTVRDADADLFDADMTAVAAFDDTNAVFRQGWAINADAYRPLTPEQVSARIAQARVRARFAPTDWAPLPNGEGPRSYGEFVEATARDKVWTASASKGTVDKHRGAWSLITDAAVSHDDARAYGDAFLITRYSGGITAARKQTARIAALPSPERADAFRALADLIIPTRAAAKAEQARKADEARKAEQAEQEAAEATAATMTPAERILAILAAGVRIESEEGAMSGADWAALAEGLAAVAADATRRAAEALV